MPAFEQMDTHQRAVLWPALTGRDKFDEYGDAKTGSPQEIHVRWIEKEMDGLRPDGTPVRLDAQIHAIEDIAVGSVLWLAPNEDDLALNQWYETGSAGEDSGLMVVEALLGRARDLKGRFTRREYGLVKYRDEAPV